MPPKVMIVISIVVICLGWLGALGYHFYGGAPASGGAPHRTYELGTFDGWSARKKEGPKGPLCFLTANPDKAVGAGGNRGATAIVVGHRPVGNSFYVNVAAGDEYKKKSRVTFAIDGRPFKLRTDGDNAWSYDIHNTLEMVAAMKRGRRVVVTGTSRRRSLTTNGYSLKGFAEAYNAAMEACGVKAANGATPAPSSTAPSVAVIEMDDDRRAIEIRARLAREAYGRAIGSLARMYREGLDVPRDRVLAAALERKAAENRITTPDFSRR